MHLERIFDTDLAQASYLVGCQVAGEAIVVDPRRDIAVYLELAERHGFRIVGVAETHIHADYLSGTRELAAATGAAVYVSDEGGPDWRYGPSFDDAVRMRDGHRIRLGNIEIEAVHTPGHTPEHLSFLITDGAQATEPGFMLTGDFVFVGDVGRPDLIDAVADGADTRYAGAAQLFASLRDRLLVLPDHVQLLPGHGSGSACGKALGAVPASTVGYERRFAWWAEYLERADEAGFVSELLSGQPDAHAYFARMKRENRTGPALLGQLSPLEEYTAAELRAQHDAGRIVLVDTRGHAEVQAGTVAGALNIPGSAQAASYGAWAIDPEREERPLVLLAESVTQADELRDHLVRVGIDGVRGFVRSLDGLDLVRPVTVGPAELAREARSVLLDVRTANEHAEGCIPGSVQIVGGQVLWQLSRLPDPEAGRIIVYCRSGARSSVVASALRGSGYDVAELDGGYAAWEASEAQAN